MNPYSAASRFIGRKSLAAVSVLILCIATSICAWSQGHKLSEAEIRKASNVDAGLESNLPVTIQRAPQGSRVADRYIVLFKTAVADPEFEARDIEVHSGGKLHHTFTHALKGFAATLSPEAVEKLRHDPRVAMIQEDGPGHAMAAAPVQSTGIFVPTSPQSPAPSWALDRIDQRNLPLDNSFSFPASGGAGVHIYILDSGILGGINGLAGEHVELQGRVGSGFDAITPGGNANDCEGHGTFNAGLAAGTTFGVAKQAIVHPVRVLDCTLDQGGGVNAAATLVSEIIAGIDWVTSDHLAHQPQKSVANMSLGTAPPNVALDLAVQNSINAGIVYVIAAGDAPQQTLVDLTPLAPAPTLIDIGDACNISPGRVGAAITVGAMTNYGKQGTSVVPDLIHPRYDTGGCVDLFAPGDFMTSAGITTTTAISASSPPNGFNNTGTSYAAPVVAGVAALFLGANPTANPSQVASAITTNATNNVLTWPFQFVPTGANRLLYSDFQTDIQTTVSSNQGAPAVGLLFTYTFQVHNSGPYNTMDSVLFTDTLPAGISVANSIAPGVSSIATTRGSCSGSTTITCDLGRLAVGDSAVIAISVLATTPGTYINAGTAVLQSGQTDRAPANNTASVTVTSK